eukprot:jgi/Bigna1/130767/aug1.12_g5475
MSSEEVGRRIEESMRGLPTVESQPAAEIVKKRRDPRDPLASRPGIDPPKNIPSGISSTNLLQLLRKHKKDPENWTVEALAVEYKLDSSIVEEFCKSFTLPYMGRKMENFHAVKDYEVAKTHLEEFILFGDSLGTDSTLIPPSEEPLDPNSTVTATEGSQAK